MQMITQPPTFISQEEHAALTSSTPSSFSDIPPVLRHVEEDVEIELDPAMSELGQGKLKGKLWVTEAQISFLQPSNLGFSLDYPSLTLHAISPASGSDPAFLYCQLEDVTPKENGVAAADEVDDDDDEAIRELRIWVKDPSTLDKLFEALSLCASLHTTTSDSSQNFFGLPADNEDEDDQEDEAFDDAEEGDGGRVRADFQTPNARFRPY